MPNDLEIAFCVPTYNRAHVLLKTSPINAAICARHPNCTLTYLDNASKDNSGAVLSEMLGVYGDKCRLISNPENIGLKGSLLRLYRDFSSRGKMLVLLSDEDIIYEPGLQALEDELVRDASFITPNRHYCFNYLTRRGKDFPYRRRGMSPLTWSRWEPFTFGYISGFASTLDTRTAAAISELAMLDSRNIYPHWAAFDFIPSAVALPGIELAAEFSIGNSTSYHQELIYQESHLSQRHSRAYCTFHATRATGWKASLWRARYDLCNALMRASANKSFGIKDIVSALALCVLWPRIFVYYCSRPKT